MPINDTKNKITLRPNIICTALPIRTFLFLIRTSFNWWFVKVDWIIFTVKPCKDNPYQPHDYHAVDKPTERLIIFISFHCIILITKVLIRNNNPTLFNTMRALSFHNNDTHNHRVTPIIDRPKSYGASSMIPRILIALNTKTEATHLTYQSRVYFGVTLLYHLAELSNSSCDGLSCCVI